MAIKTAPHPFTLRQLQYAVAVADEGGFRKAARACRVSQPSLSSQIAALEGALGVRLFERHARAVLVTAAGAAVLLRARRTLAEADDLLAAAVGLGDPFEGTWRLGVIPTISPYLLPPVTPVLRRRWPGLHPLWVEDKTSTLVAALGRGEIDAAILALEADLGDLDHAVIATDPFVLAFPPGHPLASGRPAHTSDLEGAKVLLLDDGHCFREQALSICSLAGSEELGFRATSLSTLAQMVAGGAGVTLLPELSVATEAPRAGLSVRRFAAPVPGRTIALAWRRSSPLAAPLRLLAAAIGESWPTPR